MKKTLAIAKLAINNLGIYLIHNGFNDSAYSYCNRCGETCLLNLWQLPTGVEIKDYGVIPESVEPFLKPCECGGVFKKGASPHCPHCNTNLSPVEATKYIEANAPGTNMGWRWQQSWEGLYCIVIEERVSKDCWKEKASNEGLARFCGRAAQQRHAPDRE